MALRTTYISRVMRLFRLMAERYFLSRANWLPRVRLTLARKSWLHRIRSSLFAYFFNPPRSCLPLLPVPLIKRRAPISASGRDRTQPTCEWRQPDSGRVYWRCMATTAHTRHGQEGLARDPRILRTILYKERFSTFVIDTFLSFTLQHFLLFCRQRTFKLKKKRACNNACTMQWTADKSAGSDMYFVRSMMEGINGQWTQSPVFCLVYRYQRYYRNNSVLFESIKFLYFCGNGRPYKTLWDGSLSSRSLCGRL